MRKNAPKYPFLTILDILSSAQFSGIYIMSIIFATKRKVAKIPTLRPTLQLLPHIAPTNTMPCLSQYISCLLARRVCSSYTCGEKRRYTTYAWFMKAFFSYFYKHFLIFFNWTIYSKRFYYIFCALAWCQPNTIWYKCSFKTFCLKSL